MLRPNKGSRMTVRRKASFLGLYGLPWATFVNYERITIKFNRDTVGGMMHGRGTFEKAQSYHDKFYRDTEHRGFHVRGTRLPYHDKFLIVIRSAVIRSSVDTVRKGIDWFVYRITTRLLKRGTLRAIFSVSFRRGVVIYTNEYTLLFTLNKLSRDTGFVVCFGYRIMTSHVRITTNRITTSPGRGSRHVEIVWFVVGYSRGGVHE